MSYENAPATKLLATHCCSCGRPLLDSVSVEVGMGPDCRKKYMDKVEASDTARHEANKVVHYIAAQPDADDVPGCISQLREMGFTKLADTLVKRLIPVQISEDASGNLVVKAPYSEAFVASTRTLPGRFWVREEKVTRFAPAAKQGLWAALKVHFGGKRALGPKGAFIIK